MTELEGHLLNALEHLQQDYMRRLNEWESAFAELQKMHAVTQQNNAILNERVVNLTYRKLKNQTIPLSTPYAT
ncbi:TPA: MbeD family mobilization/exclusion protein [Salmonella enterica subsp. enterica serovar Typhimurium var. monophasic 4,[5],12:i:-]|nr:MbeD family mobilization/exclusion protein [Salmonella enterica subsp. enterica serovar Typhimurium var. monophasic 4,[5],12:i:-]